jgi:dTDP-glucose 4,6-dehydratase
VADGRCILVTGGAGFIGSNFVRYLLRERPGTRIVNLDCLSYSGNLANLADVQDDPRYKFVRGDICDLDLDRRLIAECDAVVHLAAESHVDRSVMDSRPFIQTNVLGTQTLLEAVRQAGGRRFLHVSTDEVYGSLPLDAPGLRFNEDSPLEPNSPYAASKASADLLVRAYRKTYGIDAVISRCSNNFGPYQLPEKVIPLFVTNLLAGRKVPLYGTGRNVRDWIHVEDHCEALLALLEKGRSGEIYNIGANNDHSNLELTDMILRILGASRDMIEYVKDRPAHDLRYAIDAAKIQRELNWRPTRSQWPGALEQTVRWYADHPEWVSTVRNAAYQDYYRRQYGQSDQTSAPV